jgi:amino acid adenylation domain-containing protein
MGNTNAVYLDSELEEEKKYWLGKLSGEIVTPYLPLDFKRPPAGAAERVVQPIGITSDLSQTLLKFCSNREELLLSAVITALKICLHKYTGLEIIVVGTAIHKKYSEIATFNKVLALHDKISGDPTIKQLLHSVKQTLSEAYAHQKYPFERILGALGLESDDAGFPLLNVVAILENINDRSHVSHLKNDLTFAFVIDQGVVSGQIEYDSRLFSKETIRALSDQYLRVLHQVVNTPDARLSALDWLSAEGRRKILVDFNSTRSSYPKDKTIHELIEEQVARTPAAVAVSSQGRHITYRDLNAKAGQLARCLRANGVKPGDRVGLFLEHSIETIVGVLGVLKAGAAYVPLDIEHPLSRISFILADAQISILLTQEKLLDKIQPDISRVICLDSDSSYIAESGEGLSPSPATPSNVVYVIYTSGSTGEPKGVQIQHAALVNYLWWAKNVYLRDDRLDFPLYSSLAFDLTITSVFVPLITGNRIIAYPQVGGDSPLLHVIEDNQAGVLKLTPSHLSILVERDNKGSKVRRLIVGGEAFETDLARRALKSFGPDVEIFNEYGPTEATVGCMVHKFDPGKDARALVPIGVPAANTRIYVLDEHLNPAPENVVGELYISGDGLAKGYLKRDELTASRFVDNPFVAGEKIYRAGDLARRLPEGTLEYIGRNDGQVKYHGYRVELNEIRVAINRHSDIQDSVVVIAKDAHGFDVMVAYYVSESALEVAELRSFLGKLIIEATIPGVFVQLDRLPLTLNGKLDYRALPTLEEAQRKLKRGFVAPRTPTESALAEIWSELIGVERVGVNDNFFALGGHSLMALRVISRIRNTFQVEFSMRILFDHPTVSELALMITQM